MGDQVSEQSATDTEPKPTPSSGAPLAPLPERLRLIDESVGFVGRTAEVETLAQGLSAVTTGGIRVALVGGEPGIGKTRLAAHQARIAHRQGVLVLYGRSEAERGIPVQAFAEIFGALANACGEELLSELGEVVWPLARVVPQIKQLLRESEASPPDDPGPADEHELFHAGSSMLAAASRRQPLLLILDDTHWADRPTALMLKYLLSSSEPINALALATYRTTEIEPGSTVSTTLLDLQRQPNVIDLVLEGLDPHDSKALAAAVAGHPLAGPELTLAELLHGETAGNPLFLTQLLRSLSEAGAIDVVAGHWSLRRQIEAIQLPGTVTETLRARVERLGDDGAAALAAASVIGTEFELGLLQRVAGVEATTIETALDGAGRAGLIARSQGGGPFEFTHPLIARVLYDGVGAAARGALHHRAAVGLEEQLGEGIGSHAPVLARHWLEALPGNRSKARQWTARAGEQALRQFEAEAAARWFSRAIELDERASSAARCDLLIGLGTAERISGQPRFRETLLSAARLAIELDDSDRLVESALANNRGFASASGAVDTERIAILELALERVGEGDCTARALLLATLAAELSFSGEWERRVRLSDQALALARRLGDARTLSSVLTARFVPIWMPQTLDERLANSSENVRVADALGDPAAQFGAVHWHSVALLQAGRIDEAVVAIDREQELARQLADATPLWIAAYDRGNLAAIFGRLDEAEDHANEALRIATESGQPDALPFFGSQLASIRYEQGRLAELQELLAKVVADNPGIPAFRSLLALAYVESELPEQARNLLTMELETSFEEIPRDVTWLAGHVIYAHVCAELNDPVAAEILYDRIQPFADQIVYTGISAWGDGDHALGRLAATLGNHDAAVAHLEAARARARRLGAAVWAVRVAIDSAAVLLARGAVGDAELADRLLADAIAEAPALENVTLLKRAENLASHSRAQRLIDGAGRAGARLRMRHAPQRSASETPPETWDEAAAVGEGPMRLRCEGDTWSLSHPNGTLRLRDGKGVRYLAMLLADPGVERHAVDLQSGPALRADAGVDGLASELSVRAADGDAGAVLDEQAKAEYRTHIEELRSEIEEAEAFNDPERAERAREELEFVGRELAAAVGIGGRDRKAASSAERARHQRDQGDPQDRAAHLRARPQARRAPRALAAYRHLLRLRAAGVGGARVGDRGDEGLSGKARTKVAVLGGGAAGLAAASGRGAHGRIEEHGLHVWFGFYRNAFELLERCYAELERPDCKRRALFSSCDQAFSAADQLGLTEPIAADPPGAAPEAWSTSCFPLPDRGSRRAGHRSWQPRSWPRGCSVPGAESTPSRSSGR